MQDTRCSIGVPACEPQWGSSGYLASLCAAKRGSEALARGAMSLLLIGISAVVSLLFLAFLADERRNAPSARIMGSWALLILVAKSISGEICHENWLFPAFSGEYRPSFVLEKERTSLRKSTSPPVSNLDI